MNFFCGEFICYLSVLCLLSHYFQFMWHFLSIYLMLEEYKMI